MARRRRVRRRIRRRTNNRAHGKHISAKTRLLIVQAGFHLQSIKIHRENLLFNIAKPKIKYADIIKLIGRRHYETHNKLLDYRCVKRWWERRNELKETGKLVHRVRSGRPIHPAFATEADRKRVSDFIFSLQRGEHQQHVLDEFDIKSPKTLRKHTKKEISWVYPPRQHAYDTTGIKNARMKYARWALNNRDIPRNATFVDHKFVYWFGKNRRHQMRPKRRGDDYIDLEPDLYMLHNPSLHCFFACNRNGVTMFKHGDRRDKLRGAGRTVDNISVNSAEVVRALRLEIVPFMRRTGSDYIICDGVRVQHTAPVVAFLESRGITLHSQTDNAPFPAYSHCFNVLDFKVFADYQNKVGDANMKLERSRSFTRYTDTREALLWDTAEKFWMNDYIRGLARKIIMEYSFLCREVLYRKGDIKNIHTKNPRCRGCRSVAERGRGRGRRRGRGRL